MSLDPDREPITRPVFVWLEIASLLAHHGDGGLAEVIRQAMNGRRLGDHATVPLTIEEQVRVDAAAGSLGGQYPG